MPGWVPAGRVSLLSGEGAVGKTRIALQLAAAAALGKPNAFLGMNPLPLAPAYVGEPAPVCWASWETAPGDFQRRLRAAHGIGDDIEQLQSWLRYKRATAPAWGVADGAHISTRGGQLSEGVAMLDYAEGLGARLLVLDPLAGAFAANENDRSIVRAFLAWLSVWAERTGCAVLILSHPPKSESAFSGSTDWRNGAQALLTLRPCGDDECDMTLLGVDKLNEGAKPPPECFGWNDRAYTLTAEPPCEHVAWGPGAASEGAARADNQRRSQNGASYADLNI